MEKAHWHDGQCAQTIDIRPISERGQMVGHGLHIKLTLALDLSESGDLWVKTAIALSVQGG